jgi:hypothetical protein
MKSRLIAFCVLLMITGSGGVAAARSTEFLELSLPQFQVPDGESIASIKCTITGGRIITLSRVPEMWSFTIENGDGGVSTLTGHALVGAAEFRNADLEYFRNFLEVERPNPPEQYDRLFDVTVSLVLVSNATGASERNLTFSRKNLTLSVQNEKRKISR